MFVIRILYTEFICEIDVVSVGCSIINLRKMFLRIAEKTEGCKSLKYIQKKNVFVILYITE